MTDVLFYHLERAPLERVLPELLEKTLERGWRAVVQAGSRERAEALDSLLWTYREDSFLPHGLAGDGEAAHQPVLLTEALANPNGAQVRFLVDGAGLDDIADYQIYQRVVFIFDGRDETATASARERWKSAAAAGLNVTYWRQNDAGRWEKKG